MEVEKIDFEKEFDKEIDVIKRLINGFLSTNPALSQFEVTSLIFSLKEDKVLEFQKAGNQRRFDDRCRLCRDATGHLFCYNGPLDRCPRPGEH